MDNFLFVTLLFITVVLVGATYIALDYLFEGNNIRTLNEAYTHVIVYLLIMQTGYWNLPDGELTNTLTGDKITIEGSTIHHVDPNGEKLMLFITGSGAPVGTTVNDALFIRKLILKYKMKVAADNQILRQKEADEDFRVITKLRKLK